MPPSPTAGRATRPRWPRRSSNPTTGKVVKTIAPEGHRAREPPRRACPTRSSRASRASSPTRRGPPTRDFAGFPANWNLAGKTGTATNPGANEPNSWFVAFGPNPNPQYVVLAVIDEGGYGAEAAAPLVRNIFDYIVTNPVGGVPRRPPPPARPRPTLPASNPPFGTPTTTTTVPGATTTTGAAATRPPTTTPTTTTPPGGSSPVGLGARWRLSGHRWNGCCSVSPSRRATSAVSRVPSTPSTVRARSPGCSSTPTPTRSGSPTRGCRSSTRSSTSAPTPSPSGRTPPGWTWRRPCGPPACPSSAWSSTWRPADFDVLAFNLSAELVYTNVLNLLDLAAVPLHSGRPRARGPLGDRRGPLRLQSRAPGGLRRRLRPGRRGRDRRGDQRRHGGVAGPAGGGARPPGAAPGAGRDRRGLRPGALHLDLSRRPPGLHPARTGPACRPTWPSGR